MLPPSEILAPSHNIASQQQQQQHPDPVNKSVKKVTRHWEAWTPEEEEKFFLALRQVGKNFEKITCQVESKNKDQVRHYYYRLIKRMNKLLSSEYTVDPKNSRDVNAAMLCWWSLLEKHRCSSSKLHLKPRRLKAFVTALEQLLLKDRKKGRKKSTAKTASADLDEPVPTILTPVPVAPTRKRSSRNITSETSNQGSDVLCRASELSLTGLVVPVQSPVTESRATEIPGAAKLETEEGPSPSGAQQEMLPPKLPASDMEKKIKLQLFPIDEPTKSAVERDGHNPHLELTLKGSKSISSVLQHLLQKWGGCSVASGELRLYPFRTAASSWGLRDSGICAADVYYAVGNPAVFRLRYGWSQPGTENATTSVQVKEEKSDVDSQACGWLYEKSTDGFGQRLWRDEAPPDNGVCTMDWVDSLTVNVSQLLHNPASKQTTEPAYSIWGGEETCDAFSFKKKERLQEVIVHSQVTDSLSALRRAQDVDADGPLLGNSQGASPNLDGLRSSSLDLYWADSLGALDGGLSSVQGQSLLLNSNSSLGAGISGSLFPDSLDGFRQ